ncbi:MAG TPA: hypothetical protein VGB85_26125 [Nannocystis sp.]|jgi:hypothetical protein
MDRRALALGLLLVACGDDGSDTEATQATGTGSTGAVVTAGTPTTGATDTGATDTGEPPGSTGDATSDASDTGDTGSNTSTGEPVGPMGHFLAIGDGGRRVRSSDGVVWDGLVGSGLLDTDDELAAPDALRALAVGDGYIVAVGGGGNFWKGNAMVMRSTDGGVTWQEDLLKDKPDFSPHKLYGAAASGQVVVAAGMRGKAIRSEDGGLDWTDISFEDQGSRLLGVAAQGDTFVVVGWTDNGESPDTSVVLTSPDLGLTWGAPDHSFERLDTIAAGNGTFVAIGGLKCLRSQDGVAWTDCGPISAGFKGVAFAGDEFVLATAEGLATSLDGVAWTTPTLPPVGSPAQLARGNGRYVGVRWTDRGWATDLEDWSFATWATEPLRSIVFIPAP